MRAFVLSCFVFLLVACSEREQYEDYINRQLFTHYTETDLEKYDFIRLPKKDVWGILMSEEDPLAQKRYITPADLRTLPLIVSWRIVEREAKAWFGGDIDHLNVVCTYDLIDNAALLVERRIGYAFVIEGALKHFPNLVFRPLLPEVSNTSVLVWKKYQPSSTAVQKFIELAKDTYKD